MLYCYKLEFFYFLTLFLFNKFLYQIAWFMVWYLKLAINRANFDDVEIWKKIIEWDVSQSVIGHCFKILWHQKFLKRANNPGLKTKKKNHSSMSKHIRGALPFLNHAKHLVRPCCYIFYYLSWSFN